MPEYGTISPCLTSYAIAAALKSHLGVDGGLPPDPAAPVEPPVAGALDPPAPPPLMPGLVSFEGLVWMLRSPPPSGVPEGPLPPTSEPPLPVVPPSVARPSAACA